MGIILCTLSHVLHASEKFAICLAAAGIVTCLVFTFTMMLVLGIGLGYNYCFVDFKTRHKYVPGYYQYTILPATSTRRRSPKYLPPYPTLYPPQKEWWQIYPRRSNTANDNETLDMDTIGFNYTYFDKLNVSLAVSSLDMLNSIKYSDNDTIPFEEYYEKNDSETITNKEIKSNESLEKTADKIFNYSRTVLQINGLDLFALLTKLKSENKNYTVKIETD
ncbi:hypothetical protein evm_004462 [Chilo suppressalis]|nr:hypothetical protein evm_004462 [Chilo suppressalis]